MVPYLICAHDLKMWYLANLQLKLISLIYDKMFFTLILCGSMV